MIKLFEPIIEDDDVDAVVRVLRSKWLAHGPEVEMFEKEFAEYIGVKHAVAVSNGTTALYLLYQAVGIGEGDKVAGPALTFVATASAAAMLRAKPVFVDIDLRTYTVDPDSLSEVLSEEVKAVVPVHLFGHPADMDKIAEVVEGKALVLEDAAQAHGAAYKGAKVGSLGDAAIFSFYATKNITSGEGGIVTTNRLDVAEKIKLLRNHGQTRKYYHVVLGGNYRLTSIQAALARVQLRKLDKLNEIRRRNAAMLTQALRELSDVVVLPSEAPWAYHVYHLYPVRLREEHTDARNKIVECLRSKGVEVAVHYPVPLHRQPLFRDLGQEKCCPNADLVAKTEISLPCHPGLNEGDVLYVAKVFSECVETCIRR